MLKLTVPCFILLLFHESDFISARKPLSLTLPRETAIMQISATKNHKRLCCQQAYRSHSKDSGKHGIHPQGMIFTVISGRLLFHPARRSKLVVRAGDFNISRENIKPKFVSAVMDSTITLMVSDEFHGQVTQKN